MGAQAADPHGDRRFIGFFDAPPEGLTYKGRSMGHFGYDMWTNGKSIFSPDFRWALVRRQVEVPHEGCDGFIREVSADDAAEVE